MPIDGGESRSIDVAIALLSPRIRELIGPRHRAAPRPTERPHRCRTPTTRSPRRRRVWMVGRRAESAP